MVFYVTVTDIDDQGWEISGVRISFGGTILVDGQLDLNSAE